MTSPVTKAFTGLVILEFSMMIKLRIEREAFECRSEKDLLTFSRQFRTQVQPDRSDVWRILSSPRIRTFTRPLFGRSINSTSWEKSSPHSFRVFLNFLIARSGLMERRGDFNSKTNRWRSSSVNEIACCSYVGWRDDLKSFWEEGTRTLSFNDRFTGK